MNSETSQVREKSNETKPKAQARALSAPTNPPKALHEALMQLEERMRDKRGEFVHAAATLSAFNMLLAGSLWSDDPILPSDADEWGREGLHGLALDLNNNLNKACNAYLSSWSGRDLESTPALQVVGGEG
jgi:hypothetical protein